jgi:hypothetical protein
MNTTKAVEHTTGPWRVAPASDYPSGLNVDANTRGYVCLAGEWDDARAVANARLIAAAPDLLEACRAFLRAPSTGSSGPGSVTIEVTTFNLNAARAAIAKAEGR